MHEQHYLVFSILILFQIHLQHDLQHSRAREKQYITMGYLYEISCMLPADKIADELHKLVHTNMIFHEIHGRQKQFFHEQYIHDTSKRVQLTERFV